MDQEEFFSGREEAARIFEVLRSAIEALGPADVRVTKSQVAFRRRLTFAWVWTPDRYLKGRCAPLVLTLSFPYRNESPRWKEISQPKTGRFTHHLELWSEAAIDEEVYCWLRNAWQAAD